LSRLRRRVVIRYPVLALRAALSDIRYSVLVALRARWPEAGGSVDRLISGPVDQWISRAVDQ